MHKTKHHSNAPSEEIVILDTTRQTSSSQTTESILTPELSTYTNDDQAMEGNIKYIYNFINLFLVNIIDSVQAISSDSNTFTRPSTYDMNAFVKTSNILDLHPHPQSTQIPSLTTLSEQSQQTQGTLHYTNQEFIFYLLFISIR